MNKKIYGLVGKELSYSYSKIIHESFGQYSYNLYPMTEKELEEILSKREFSGLNITAPYKKLVTTFCDIVDPIAARIGAINTLYFKDGNLHGTNTDYYGFSFMLDQLSCDLRDMNVLILGTGGASSMVATFAIDSDASNVYVASRNPHNSNTGSGSTSYLGLSPIYCDYAHIPSDIDVVINTTPLGTFPEVEETPLDLSHLHRCQFAFDLIYNPFRTRFLLQGENMGMKTSSGFPMLVAQAAMASQYFVGDITEGVDENLLNSISKETADSLKLTLSNIVLIGMPGCGKTAIGKKLAKALHRQVVDIDEEIQKDTKLSSRDYIEQNGIDAFRSVETKVIKRVSKANRLIISTGGGSILKEENVAALRQNGIIVFIDRDKMKLATYGRPLSSSLSKLSALYQERLPIYRSVADFTVKNNVPLPKTIRRILDLLDGCTLP